MKKLFLLATLAFATPAFAQQPAEFTLKVTNDDVSVIGKALGKLPFDEVAGLIQKLRTQITEQSQAKTSDNTNNTGIVTNGQKGDNTVNASPKPEEKK